jgi:hypothetical protein
VRNHAAKVSASALLLLALLTHAASAAADDYPKAARDELVRGAQLV